MLFLDRGGIAALRPLDRIGHATKQDVFVLKHLIQKEKLREGMVIRGRFTKGQKHKFQLAEVFEVDGRPAKAWKNSSTFKNLTSIDPDFHYAVGDAMDDTSMRIVDLIAPIGRGQRGLLVAPLAAARPRSCARSRRASRRPTRTCTCSCCSSTSARRRPPSGRARSRPVRSTRRPRTRRPSTTSSSPSRSGSAAVAWWRWGRRSCS